jgi:DNA-binding LacI/PurR family transcriptional regulator
MVDGLLVLMPRSLPDWLDQLVTAHTPFVLIDHDGEASGADLVNAANEDGSRLATEHLIALRHRRIAHITGAIQTGSSLSRIAGWRAALEAARIPVRDELMVEGDYEEPRGREAALQLLSLPARRRPTAIVASNDRTAMGVYQAAAERGIRIPDELSVVGFDDEPAAARMQPPLTTIRQPTREMGRAGVERLIERMKHPDVAPKRIVLPVELVVRGSTAPRPG